MILKKGKRSAVHRSCCQQALLSLLDACTQSYAKHFLPQCARLFHAVFRPKLNSDRYKIWFHSENKSKKCFFFLPGTYTARPEGISTLTLYHLGLGISNTIASPKTLGLIIYIYIYIYSLPNMRKSGRVSSDSQVVA